MISKDAAGRNWHRGAYMATDMGELSHAGHCIQFCLPHCRPYKPSLTDMHQAANRPEGTPQGPNRAREGALL